MVFLKLLHSVAAWSFLVISVHALQDSRACPANGASQTACCNQTSPYDEESAEAQVAGIAEEVLLLARKKSTLLEDYSRLYHLQESIRELQGKSEAIAMTYEQRLANLPAIQEYCRDKMMDLEINAYPGLGFGVETTSDVRKYKNVFVMNFTDIITSQAAHVIFAEFTKIQPPHNTRNPTYWSHYLHLALYVASMRLDPNVDAQWRAYLDVLPVNFSLPLYFDPTAMTYLYDSQGYKEAIYGVQDLAMIYSRVYMHMMENPCCCKGTFLNATSLTFDLFRWAFTTVMTRAYFDDHGLYLFPCWDIANHGQNILHTNIHYQDNAAKPPIGGLTAHVTRDVTSGVQVYHEYNSMYSTVGHFFKQWGIIELNAAIYVEVPLKPTDRLYRLKRALLARINSHKNNAYNWALVVQHESMPIELDSYHFLVVMATGKLQKNRKKKLPRKAWKRTFQHLCRCAQNQIGKYKHKREPIHDWLEKKSDDFSYQSKGALQTILAELEVLKRCRLFAAATAQKLPFIGT